MVKIDKNLEEVLKVLDSKNSIVDNTLFDEDMAKMLVEGMKYVNLFSRQNKNKFLYVDFTSENGYFEPMYIFDDGLGGYTIDGLKGSLYE
jgi:hypothetical protein